MRPAPAPACGFIRRAGEGSSAGDRDGMRSPCSTSRRRSNSIRVLGPRGVAGTLAVQRGGTRPGAAAPETACRTGPAPFT